MNQIPNYFAKPYRPMAQPVASQQNTQGTFGDMLDAFQAGALSAVGGIFDFAGAKGLANQFYGWADDQNQQMSDAGRESMSKQIFTEDEEGNFKLGEGATDLDTWLLGFANVAGQFFPTAVPGAGAAGLVTKAAKLGSVGSKIATGVGMGVTGGSAATGQGMEQARDEIRNMPNKLKAESPIFQELIKGIHANNPDATPQEKWDLATEALADQVASEVKSDPKVLLANFGASAIGDPIIGRALVGARIAKSGAIRSAFKGFATEGATEATQAGVQQYGINEAIQPIDNRDLMQGVASAAANEGVMGGAFGGVAGGLGGFVNRQSQNNKDTVPSAEDAGVVIPPEVQNEIDKKNAAKDAATEAVKASNPILGDVLDQFDKSSSARSDAINQAVNYDIPTAARKAGAQTPADVTRFGEMLDSPIQVALDRMRENRSQTVQDMVNKATQNKSPTTQDRFLPKAFEYEGQLLRNERVPNTNQKPNNTFESEAVQPLRSPNKQITQKDIIFAGNDSGVNVKANGNVFLSPKEALISKNARAAKRAGNEIEAVPFGNGFGWRITKAADNEQSNRVDTRSIEQSGDQQVRSFGNTLPDSQREAGQSWLRDTNGQLSRSNGADLPVPDGRNTNDNAVVQNKFEGLPIQEAPLSELTLSDDVPQFKDGANADGVVTPLGGKFDRTGVAPIQVWVREDGRKEVVTGRHRLDLARRSGEKTIPAQFHYEEDGFTIDNAAQLDAILNIRDNQGQVKDYVNYFQANKQLTEEKAKSEGLLRQALGRRAYTIATRGSEDVIASHSAGIISDEAAERLANVAPNQDKYQTLGLQKLQEGKGIGYTENFIRAVKSMEGDQGGSETMDMFGQDTSASIEADKMVKIASRKQRELRERLSAIKGAAKNPKLAKAEGVDIKDPNSLNKRIEQLTAQAREWDSFHTNPKLVAQIRNEIGAQAMPEQSSNDQATIKQTQELSEEDAKKLNDEIRKLFDEKDEEGLTAYKKSLVSSIESLSDGTELGNYRAIKEVNQELESEGSSETLSDRVKREVLQDAVKPKVKEADQVETVVDENQDSLFGEPENLPTEKSDRPLYRGQPKNSGMVLNEKGLLWITPEKEYASDPHYGGKEGGEVIEVDVKESELNLFDYKNPDHANILREKKSIIYRSAANGDFRALQDEDVVKTIKSKGFDGFYAIEPEGQESIALFNVPNKKQTTETVDKVVDEPKGKVNLEPTLESYNAFMDRIDNADETLTANDVLEAFKVMRNSVEAIEAELNTLTKDKILKYYRGYTDSGMKKAQIARRAAEDIITRFGFVTTDTGMMITSGIGRDGRFDGIQEKLEKLTTEQLQKNIQAVKAEQQKRINDYQSKLDGAYDPKTLEDFRNAVRLGASKDFTPEQWAKYDRLHADEKLEQQAKEAIKTVQAIQDDVSYTTHETAHSKKNTPLFVVSLDGRVEKDLYSELNSKAKSLGGYYSAYNKDGAIPGFQFKSEDDRKNFLTVLDGKAVDKVKEDKDKTDSLEALTDRIEERATGVINQDRKTNTARRSSMAAGVISNAESELDKAAELRAISEAIKSGEAKYLAKLSTGTERDLIASLWNRLRYDVKGDAREELLEQEIVSGNARGMKWRKGVKPEQKVRFAQYPLTTMRAENVKRIAKEMANTPGYKLAATKLLSDAGKLAENDKFNVAGHKHGSKFMQFVRENETNTYFDDIVKDFFRLKRMGITTLPMLRAALLEYNAITTNTKPVKVENATTEKLKYSSLQGKYKENDFFNSTKSVVEEVVNYADIKPGMKVLEPSAGAGHLADGAADIVGKDNIQTFEIAYGLQEFLKDKGYKVTGGDFLEQTPTGDYDRIIMNPPFSNDQEITHIEHAYKFLKPGGRLVAVTSSMAGERSNKRNVAFKEWLDELGAEQQDLPEGSFRDAINPTGVNTKIIVIDKPSQNILFNKSNKPLTGNPVPLGQAKTVTKDFIDYYTGLDDDMEITVTDKKPSEVFKNAKLEPGDDTAIKGGFDKDSNRLYIFSQNHSNIEDVRKTLREELLVHKGLGVFKPEEIAKLINTINGTRTSINPKIKAIWADIERNYGKAPELVQAEEFLGKISQIKPSSLGKYWNQIVSTLTRLLRKVGLVRKGITFTEMQAVVAEIGDRLRSGDKPENYGFNAQSAKDSGISYNKNITPNERAAWNNFPDVIIHNTLSSEKNHPDYQSAKKGDIKAAVRLVTDLISKDKLMEIKRLVGDSKAITLAVHAKESQGDNKIPRAMADYISMALGLDVDLDVVQSSYVSRSNKDGFGRLAVQPTFEGDIKKGDKYIIVDDTVTQGGTLANLRGYIESNGGNVIVATTLTGKQYSAKLALSSDTLSKLRDQYSGTNLETWWREIFGYGFEKLTESEARYLTRVKDVNAIRDRVTEARQLSSAQGGDSDTQSNGRYKDLRFNRSTPDTRTAEEKIGQGAALASDTITQKGKKVVNALKSSAFWNRAAEGMFDGLHGIKQAEQSAGITDPTKMGYTSARLATGLGDMLHAVFHKGALEWKDGVTSIKKDTKGLLEVIGMLPEGDGLNNWLAWMAAGRAEMLSKQGRENNLTKEDIATLKSKAKGNEALFEEVRKEYNKINSATLNLAQEAGLPSPEQRAAFDEEWYVPFFREQSIDNPELTDVIKQITAPHTTKTGIVGQSAQIKELIGGKGSTKDLLKNIIQRQVSMIDAAVKNNAAREIANNLAGTEYMTRDDDAGINEAIDKIGVSRGDLAKNFQKVRVMENGKPVYYYVSDPALLRGLLQVHDVGSKALFNKMARSAKRFLTTGVTLSPDFIIRNFIRDAAHAWMVNKDGAKLGTDTWKGLKASWEGDDSYWNLIASGAAFQGGYIHGADPEAAQQQIRRALKMKGLDQEEINGYMKTVVSTKEGLLKAFEKYRNASDKIENANRVATYEAALKAGKSNKQALFESKDLMDYSMKGNFASLGTFIDMLPFFNARLQGMYKLGRAAAADGDDRLLKVLSKDLAFKGMKVAAFSAGLAALNGDDERYKELPEWDKDAHWHFFLGEGNDGHIRIPKPFELGIIFGTLPERLYNFSAGNQTGKDLGDSVIYSMVNTLSLNPIPQLAMPTLEIIMNRSFFTGSAIEGMADENREKADRYNMNTSDTARIIGQFSDAVGLSPKQVQHLITGYTGTMGGYVLSMSDFMARAMTGRIKADTAVADWPIIKTLYQGGREPRNTVYQDRFYDSLKKAQEAYGSYKAAIEENDPERARELFERRAEELNDRLALNRMQRKISEISKRMRAVDNNQTLTSKEKQKRLEDLTMFKNQLYEQAYTQLNLADW